MSQSRTIKAGLQATFEKGLARLVAKSKKYRRKVAERTTPLVLQRRGYCTICECEVMFASRDSWLRDHYKCSRCASIPRERALMWVLQQRFPNWRSLSIHESSPINRGASKRIANECADYQPSYCFPTGKPGSVVDGRRCENLEQLAFADACIDIHISQDVLEHVLRPRRAFAEIARTLKPGGAHLFTVPLVNKQKPSKPRVRVDDEGHLEYLEPPVYHGNPIDANGSLVTYDWGYDIVEHIERSCGLLTQIMSINDSSRGLEAEYLEVLVTTKPLA